MSLISSKVARPYAKALFDLAKSNTARYPYRTNNSLKETLNDINNISHVLVNSSDLKKFLGNPLVTRGAKKNVIKDIFRVHISTNTLKFLLVLVDRNRIQFFESIAKKFLELGYEEESLKIAKITSSIQLSADQQIELVEKLKKITRAKQVKLALKVDPQLIGGCIIQIGSQMIDMSIRGQLKKISALLGV